MAKVSILRPQDVKNASNTWAPRKIPIRLLRVRGMQVVATLLAL
jgi:hypothetical protein